MKIKQKQVVELESQASHLKQLDPGQEENIVAKKQHVEERYEHSCIRNLCCGVLGVSLISSQSVKIRVEFSMFLNQHPPPKSWCMT